MAVTGIGSTGAANKNYAADKDIVMKTFSYKDGAGQETVYHLKDCVEISIDSYTIPAGSDTYEELKNNLRRQSISGAGFSHNQLFSESRQVMADYYDGKLGREDVKNIFKEYFYHSGGMISPECATRTLAGLYEHFSRANTRAACTNNNREGNDLLESNGFDGSGIYYNADWYWKCEEMQNLFRETANELADERGAEHVDFEYVEKNTVFTLDGGITYNGVWNAVKLRQSPSGTSYFLDTDLVPPKGFIYCNAGAYASSYANMKSVKETVCKTGTDQKYAKYIFLAAMNSNVNGTRSLLHDTKNYIFSINAEEKSLYEDAMDVLKHFHINNRGSRMEFMWMGA